jgi:hypothetical protein
LKALYAVPICIPPDVDDDVVADSGAIDLNEVKL